MIMKSLVFDTSSIISIVTNNLLWVLHDLKKRFRGDFCIPKKVYNELITRPLRGKKFKLEAVQLLSEISKGTLKIIKDSSVERKSLEILKLANSIFMSKDTYIKIVHDAEIQALTLAKDLDSQALVIDERTTRVLVENPEKLAELLERKLHSRVVINNLNLKKFRDLMPNLKIIRSVELMTVAYEFGLLNKYLVEEKRKIVDLNTRKVLLEGVLWGLKLRGCSISVDEIHDIMKLERLQ